MKVLLAPQAYKESYSVFSIVQFMAEGVRLAAPEALIRVAPMADGGDGTLDVLAALLEAEEQTTTVAGPLGKPIRARWAIADGGKMALIEAAQACGLWRLPPERRDPMRATSRGVGQLIRAALDAGCLNIILTLGGTATMDCGTGMLAELGIVPATTWGGVYGLAQ